MNDFIIINFCPRKLSMKGGKMRSRLKHLESSLKSIIKKKFKNWIWISGADFSFNCSTISQMDFRITFQYRTYEVRTATPRDADGVRGHQNAITELLDKSQKVCN